MKGILLCIVISISCLTGAKAQIIPNAGFENWSLSGPIENPDGWAGSPAVTKSNDVHSGMYAMQLKADTFTNPLTLTLDTIPGRANTGAPGTGPGMPGIAGYPSTARPDSITGWYKYLPNGQDTFVVHVVLSKWNSGTNVRDIICDSHYFDGPANVYSRFSFPLQYLSGNTPDTAVVEFISSTSAQQNPILHSVLLIDDVAFITNIAAGVSTISDDINKAIQSYPNPANQFLTISNLTDETVLILNASGQAIERLDTKNTHSIQLDVTEWTNGIYFIKSANGRVKQFTVKH